MIGTFFDVSTGSYVIDLDQIRIAGLAVRHAACNDDDIVWFQIHDVLCEQFCAVEEDFRGRKERTHDGCDGP